MVTLGDTPIELSPADIKGKLAYAGYRLHLPASASLHWPALPHNPYRKDGRATVAEARIEVRIPLTAEHPAERVTVEIAE